MANRFIIGKGELLTYDIGAPPMFPSKAHPYTLEQAQQILIPQIATAAAELARLPREACPFDLAVAKLQLHPAYISKSYFPRAILRDAGLVSIGSRTIRLRPATIPGRRRRRNAKRPSFLSPDRVQRWPACRHWPGSSIRTARQGTSSARSRTSSA